MAAGNREPTVLWALLGFDGRINREVFWLSIVMCNFLVAFLMLPSVDPETGEILLGPLAPVVSMAGLWVVIALAVKRLHDRGLTGWLAAVLAVPFLGVLALLVIGFMPGDRGPNAFGPASNTRGPL